MSIRGEKQIKSFVDKVLKGTFTLGHDVSVLGHQWYPSGAVVTADKGELSLTFSYDDGTKEPIEQPVVVMRIAPDKSGYRWVGFTPNGLNLEEVQGDHSYRTAAIWQIDSKIGGVIAQGLEKIAGDDSHENREAAKALLAAKRDYDRQEEAAAKFREMRGGDIRFSPGLGRPAY